MTVISSQITPELRLALLAACEAATPRERGAARARRWTTRLTLGLASTAGVVAAYDALLLAAA